MRKFLTRVSIVSFETIANIPLDVMVTVLLNILVEEVDIVREVVSDFG